MAARGLHGLRKCGRVPGCADRSRSRGGERAALRRVWVTRGWQEGSCRALNFTLHFLLLFSAGAESRGCLKDAQHRDRRGYDIVVTSGREAGKAHGPHSAFHGGSPAFGGQVPLLGALGVPGCGSQKAAIDALSDDPRGSSFAASCLFPPSSCSCWGLLQQEQLCPSPGTVLTVNAWCEYGRTIASGVAGVPLLQDRAMQKLMPSDTAFPIRHAPCAGRTVTNLSQAPYLHPGRSSSDATLASSLGFHLSIIASLFCNPRLSWWHRGRALNFSLFQSELNMPAMCTRMWVNAA